MNINLPYSPTTSLEELEDHLTTNYFKKPYDRFMWWRSYTLRNKPLTPRHPFKDRILNGDFDIGSFKYEAQVVEHRMNDKWRELYKDTGRYVEETSLDRARRKRLLEDFEKDETNKLQELERGFLMTFKITKDQYEEEVMNTDLELIDLYFYIEEKYGTYWKPAKIPLK